MDSTVSPRQVFVWYPWPAVLHEVLWGRNTTLLRLTNAGSFYFNACCTLSNAASTGPQWWFGPLLAVYSAPSVNQSPRYRVWSGVYVKVVLCCNAWECDRGSSFCQWWVLDQILVHCVVENATRSSLSLVIACWLPIVFLGGNHFINLNAVPIQFKWSRFFHQKPRSVR